MGEQREESPSAEEQREILALKLAKSVVSGETWYLINSRWMKTLKQFLGMIKTRGHISNPGPIDNSCILAENLVDLKKGLAENIDYELVSEECWHLLAEWYGYYEDQLPIRRKAIPFGVNYTMVEIYMVDLKCYRSFDLQQQYLRIPVSKADKISTLHSTIREKFNIKNYKKTRLWLLLGVEKYELLNLEGTVQEIGLSDNQSIVIETQSPSGTWPRNKENEHADLYGPGSSKDNDALTVRSSQVYTGLPRFKPGVCGLFNLGNTCFMNSVLQCLSNTSQTTEYFLAGRHLRELNLTNPMGMHGEIARSYGELLQSIWSGRFPAANPLEFKVQVSKFNPLFGGCHQHDAQELLTFLLDGLHEDLNRIKNKPYVPNEDYTGQEDHVFAEESWSNYKLRNDSIIVDTFHGLLKSRVICPECEKLSVSFDPFSTLSLPLPQNKECQFKVKFIPYNPQKKEVFYRIVLPKKCLFKDLCNEVALRAISNPSLLVVAELTNSHIHIFFSPDEYLEPYEDKDLLYIYELSMDPYSNETEFVVTPICFWEQCKSTDEFTYDHLFGIPVLAVLPKSSINKPVLVNTITHLMSRHFVGSSDLTENEQTSTSDYENHSSLLDVELYLLDNGVPNVPVRLEFDEEGECIYNLSEVFDTYDPGQVFSRQMFIVKMSVDQKNTFYQEQSPDYGLDFHAARFKDRGRLAINDCFDLFTTCEKLGVENAWYCPTCRIHQQATKKFDIWKLPKILIIHFKRFSYTKGGDKIDTFVEFPLTGLKLSKYIINPCQQGVTYNLFGVINHYGTMSGGHYTAYCKNRNNRKWYCFDDDSATLLREDAVLSRAAYVLFYMRNDTSWIDVPIQKI